MRLSVPTGSVVVVTVATPAALTVAAVPTCVEPLKNETVPRGEPLNVGDIVAVRVTDWPNADGLVVLVRTVVVDA